MNQEARRHGGRHRVSPQWRRRPRRLRLLRSLGPLPALLAAAAGSPSAGADAGLRFERLTIDHGLSQSTVFAAAQDHGGFMWFGTQDGLNRYDGYRFQVFRHDPQNANSPGNNIVNSLYVDGAGMIWLGTAQGLDRLDPITEEFTHYRLNELAPGRRGGDSVYRVTGDGTGTLWLATIDGLVRLDPETGGAVRYRHEAADISSLADQQTNFALVDDAGGVWIGTENGGLALFDPGSESLTWYRHDPDDPSSLPHDTVACGLQDSGGTLWFGTDGGLARLEPESPAGAFARYRPEPGDPHSLSSLQVRAIFEDRSGGFWVGTKDGLNRMDRETGSFSRMRHEPTDSTSISDGFIRTVFQDRSGLIWVGTDGRGLNTFDPNKEAFVTYRHRPNDPGSLSADMIWSIYEDRQGVLWVGTWGRGLNRLDEASGRFERHFFRTLADDTLAANVINEIHEDREGRFWLGTDVGLVRFDRASGRVTLYRNDPRDPTSLSHNTVRFVHHDRSDRLWVGTDYGLNLMDPAAGTFRPLGHDPTDSLSLSHDGLWTVLETASGELWFGTVEGLNRLRAGNTEFDRQGAQSPAEGGVSNQFIRSLHEDRHGQLWVGTDDGLNLFDPATGRATVYTESDGLPNDVIYGILEDDSGFLWLSTNRGLSRFDPVRGRFRNFDARDGLQSNEFNRRAYWKRRNGQLWFGGINGLTAFFPDRIRPNTYVPPVVLTSFRRLGRNVALEASAAAVRRLELSYRDSFVSFEFAALDYHAPDKNRYAYWLEGLNEGWIELGTRRELTFANLAPGDYTLRVRGSNGDGVWNEAGLAIELYVAPPFWATPWFRLVAVLATVLLLAAAYNLRTRGIRRRNLALEAEVRQRQRAEEAQTRLIGELEAKSAEIEAQNLELERSNAELERFTYTVSHDLRSPLVTIKGYLGLLEKDSRTGDPRTIQSHLGVIHNAADTMRRLLDDLLELSRISLVEGSPAPVPLAEPAREALALVAGSVQERNATVSIDAAMPTVLCDRARMVEVFQNLLENAVKFTPSGVMPYVQVGGGTRDGQALCFVRDHGVGIAPRHREKVFGLFARLDPRREGTGVGLALVKRIIENQGGRIWVESEGEGRGSTFWFALPLSHGTEASPAGPPSPPPAG